jgi:hypothetical protein
VKKFVNSGGNVFHGPDCQLVKRALGIKEQEIAFDCLDWDEKIIPHG